MKLCVAISLLLISFILMPPLYAQNSYSEFERGLNLTDSQKRRAEGVREKYTEEWLAQRQEALKRRLELMDLSKNPSANRGRIDKTQQELRDMDRSRERSYNQYRSELSQVLNEKQRQQYNTFTDSERKKQRLSQQRPRVPGARGYEYRGRERRSYPIREYPTGGRQMRGHER
jgi:Spy/CpxP family protein refolding chaperone